VSTDKTLPPSIFLIEFLPGRQSLLYRLHSIPSFRPRDSGPLPVKRSVQPPCGFCDYYCKQRLSQVLLRQLVAITAQMKMWKISRFVCSGLSALFEYRLPGFGALIFELPPQSRCILPTLVDHDCVAVPDPKLSLAMIVKNESRCLARCLQSVKAIAHEMVVADTGSTDETIKIARECGAKILHFDWVGDFAAARNFALGQTTGDWILVLDADEWAGEDLAREIAAFTRGPAAVGRLKIVSDFRRNNQTLRSQCFVARLFPRGAHFAGRIHEQLISPLPRVNLRGELWHDGYLEMRKADRNTKLLEAELEREPDNVYFLFQLALEHNAAGQPGKAFDCLQRAFASAKPGDPSAPNIAVDFIYTVMELKKFEVGIEAVARAEKYLGDFPDFFLARGLFFMNLIRSNPARYVSELPKIEQSFQRCLELGESEQYKSVRGSGTFLASYNLGVFYQVFGNMAGARRCFEAAAAQGYEPAAALLGKIKG
jgi:glycosyltransferase involved in cell wall biosynthesis